jgi:thiol-disulfide isomerase/thioredoxin
MKKQTKFIFFIIIIVIVVGGIGVFASRAELKTDPKVEAFAQCINESGAKFYGAFWCSHCQAQKEMFGSSKKFLPYIECSTPNGGAQLDICKEAGIEGYPTWVFADGSELSGELSFETLAEKTQCQLPQ